MAYFWDFRNVFRCSFGEAYRKINAGLPFPFSLLVARAFPVSLLRVQCVQVSSVISNEFQSFLVGSVGSSMFLVNSSEFRPFHLWVPYVQGVGRSGGRAVGRLGGQPPQGVGQLPLRGDLFSEV